MLSIEALIERSSCSITICHKIGIVCLFIDRILRMKLPHLRVLSRIRQSLHDVH